MPRDSIQTSPVPAGTPFTVNDGYEPLLGPFDIFGDNPFGVGGGELMTLHQGVPHVAWCEVGATIAGPYVAKWNGSDWELVVSTPPFADNIPDGNPANWPAWQEIPDNDLDLRDFVVSRSLPRLISDGTDLYVGILGQIVHHLVSGDDGGGTQVWYPQWNPWLFRLAGDTLVPVDALAGKFTLFGESGSAPWRNGYATQSVSWGLAAQEDVHGCQFIFSDAGIQDNLNAHTSRDVPQYYFYHVCTIDSTGDVSDIDVQGPLADGYLYRFIQGFDGAGDGANLAAYYQDRDYAGGAYGPNQTDSISIWTAAGGLGAALIDSSDISSTLRLSLLPDVQLEYAATVNGVRYLTFEMGGTDGTTYDIFKRIVDFTLPGAISEFIPGQPQYSYTSVPATTLDGETPIVDGLFVEPSNYWLSGHQSSISLDDGVTAVLQFDRQCGTRVGWIIWQLAAADVFFAIGSAVLYEDAFWYFQPSVPDDSPLLVAQVYKQPICRGCIPCPVNGLHVWEVV